MFQPHDLTNTIWCKSTKSGGQGQCVEVAHIATTIAVRDSKNPDGLVLWLRRSEFRDFVGKIRAGQLDLPGQHIER